VHNVNLPAQIQRVTFSRGQAQPACYFKPLAFVQGGEAEKYWGWHMLWAEPVGLFYARMDGEAWVSSNPKQLTKLTAINPQFKLEKDTITVAWQQVENGVKANMQALSSDEGRSWDIASIKP
jgi:predicted SPOUT superfamily RNA methylase MTH1